MGWANDFWHWWTHPVETAHEMRDYSLGPATAKHSEEARRMTSDGAMAVALIARALAFPGAVIVGPIIYLTNRRQERRSSDDL